MANNEILALEFWASRDLLIDDLVDAFDVVIQKP